MTIAPALLDQRALAGIGNIWRNETLFARGRPVRAVARPRRRDARPTDRDGPAAADRRARAGARPRPDAASTAAPADRARAAGRRSGPHRSAARCHGRRTGARPAREDRHERHRGPLRDRRRTAGAARYGPRRARLATHDVTVSTDDADRPGRGDRRGRRRATRLRDVRLPARARAEASRSCARSICRSSAATSRITSTRSGAASRRRVTSGAGAYHRGAMCEHYVARAAEPFRLDELWPFTERSSGSGSPASAGARPGSATTAACTAIATSAPSATTPTAATASARSETTSALVHLRRPSKLSTLTLARHPAVRRSGRPLRVQPQRRPARVPRAARPIPRAGPHPRPGRHGGRRALARGRVARRRAVPPTCLRALHDRFGGQANLAVLTADGTPHHYAGNTENPVFTFRLGRIGIVVDRHLLARSLALPVRRPGRDRPPPRPRRAATVTPRP